MIADGSARGSFVILDTLKKFVSLMDKKQSSGFADIARRFVLKGGTLLGLAHTNKRDGPDGRPIYAGTSDILDDFDCGYMISEVSQPSGSAVRVVQFENLKRRGNVVARPYARLARTSPIGPCCLRERNLPEAATVSAGRVEKTPTSTNPRASRRRRGRLRCRSVPEVHPILRQSQRPESMPAAIPTHLLYFGGGSESPPTFLTSRRGI